jgi:hypothetical protein
MEKSKPATKKVKLYDPQDNVIAEFDTVQEAIDYAEEHDLECHIKVKEGFPDVFDS